MMIFSRNHVARRAVAVPLALALWIGPQPSWAVAQDGPPIQIDPNQRLQLRPGDLPMGIQPSPVQDPDALEQLREARRQRLQESIERRRALREEQNPSEAKKGQAAPAPEEAPTEPPEAVSKLRQKVESNGGCRPMRPGERRSFTFNGDIQELVKAISKLTCNNFILTNKIRSQKFEIITGTPVSVEEIWRAFLSSLEANDFTLIRTGRYYKIVQANDGIRANLPIYGTDADFPVYDRIVTKIWKLKHAADLDRVVNFLNFFKSAPGGQIHPYPETGIIIATDFATIIDKLERILKEIDQPGALEQVHVVPVKFASASEVGDKLTQIFEPATGGAARTSRTTKSTKKKGGGDQAAAPAKEGEGPASVSKILADDRTNKLIIIASKSAFDQILSLLRELDVPEDGTQGQIHVVRLRHADAEELSSTLASLSQGRPAAAQNRRGGNAQGGNQPQGAAALFEGEVKITADQATNSLVITASKSDFNSVQRVISELDVPRFQVFVEAVIMEVSTSGDRTLGVGWHGGVPVTIDGEQSPILFSNTPSQDLSTLLASQNPLQVASLLGLAGAARGPTIAGTEDLVQGGIPAIGVLIQALKSSNDVNVVSTPHLLTMDNEEAEIQVNEQRPFPSGLTLPGLGGLGNLAQGGGAAGQNLGALGGLGLGSVQFNREDVGLTLKLKPQINDEDYVRLEIEQELSDVAGIDQVTGQVITSNRSAKTVVVVRSQDSVVIGGLVRDRETRDEAKTPLLGDIPLLGWLFKRQQRVQEKINLLLVLTPYIVRGPEDFRKIFERKMEERKEFVERFYGSSREYRAAIDWDRKVGPLASYRSAMRKEMQKAENEGPGAPDETIIRPEDIEVSPFESTPEVRNSFDEPAPAPEEDQGVEPPSDDGLEVGVEGDGEDPSDFEE